MTHVTVRDTFGEDKTKYPVFCSVYSHKEEYLYQYNGQGELLVNSNSFVL